MEETHTVVVRLPRPLARRVGAYLRAGSAYDDLSELVTVALENQLALEGAPAALGRSASEPGLEGTSTIAALRMPGAPPGVADPREAFEPLFSMTNRLFPLKVAVRVLANLPEDASLNDFQYGAAQAARALGQRLRVEDAQAGRKGPDRRWIALPVADNEDAALNRFVNHFTLTLSSDGMASGPLAHLGLAALSGGRARLTKLGLDLALAQSPLLDDGGDGIALLSDDERQLLMRAIRGNPGEIGAIHEFVEIAQNHGGRQEDVDAALRMAHASWSEAQAVAQRAAMVGRLRDLGLATVEGRGPTARIRLDDRIKTRMKEEED